MKTLVKLSALSLIPLALGACATTKEAAYQAPPPKPGSIVTDSEYVAYVEAVARRRGIGVQWINPPKRRVEGQ